jgi:hypothetical protein
MAHLESVSASRRLLVRAPLAVCHVPPATGPCDGVTSVPIFRSLM